jgi:serine protease Do
MDGVKCASERATVIYDNGSSESAFGYRTRFRTELEIGIGMMFSAIGHRFCVFVVLCTLPMLGGIVGVVSAQESTDAAKVAFGKEQARGLALAFQSAAAKMMPCVVTVFAKRPDVDQALDDLDMLEEEDANAFNAGSGVIISTDGLCVTNNHVINGSKEIRVRLADGRKMFGKDLLSDPKSDIAVFRISTKEPLSAATIGNSDALSIGDWVLAIGSPFTLDQTVSVGIISSKGRTINRELGQFLQTDANINPGNSGGALLDLNGELVGINTAIKTTNGQFQGIGFAIPSSRVKWISKELVENGKVRRAKLGVTVAMIPQYLAEELKIPVRGGVQITKIVSDSPATKAGLEIGDVVLELAGQRILTPEDFRSVVEQLPPDREYPIRFLREGKSQSLEIRPVVRD